MFIRHFDGLAVLALLESFPNILRHVGMLQSAQKTLHGFTLVGRGLAQRFGYDLLAVGRGERMELGGNLLNSRRGVHGVSLRDFVRQNNDVLGSRFRHNLPVPLGGGGFDQFAVVGEEHRGIGVSEL